MAHQQQPPCPDCGGHLELMKIVDKGGGHELLEYSAHDARKKFWSGLYPIEGRVESLMCAGCGRILLYGRPNEGVSPE